MAENMRKSVLDSSLQGTTLLKADMTLFTQFWEQMKQMGKPVSYSAMFVKAVSCVLTKLPIFNSAKSDDTILIFRDINIGFAVYANDAFYLPVICDVPSKDVFDVSAEIDGLASALEYKSLSQKDIASATFTINYLGGFMIDGFTGFVTVPQTSFLGVGRARRELGVDEEDNVAKRWVTTLSLTVDRSVVAGVPIANFLEMMQEIMNHPDDYLFSK